MLSRPLQTRSPRVPALVSVYLQVRRCAQRPLPSSRALSHLLPILLKATGDARQVALQVQRVAHLVLDVPSPSGRGRGHQQAPEGQQEGGA
jgi:hypothetical protein